MAEYTQNLNLIKPAQDEQYDVDDFNGNFDLIDDFAGRTPPRALTADKLTTGAKINGVTFTGSSNVITGLGLYSSSVIYNTNSLVYTISGNVVRIWHSLVNSNYANNPTTTSGKWSEIQLGGSSTDVLSYLKAMYPVGSIYLGTTSTCPLASLFGTWTLVAADRVLQGSSSNHSAGSTIPAGLPNITGSSGRCGDNMTTPVVAGAITQGTTSSGIGAGSTNTNIFNYLSFSAQNSNTTYGNSTTVQPSAYVVNVWRRTA